MGIVVPLDQQWEEAKPKIISFLKEGWSKHTALKKAGVGTNTKLYKLCFKEDREFRALIAKYRLPHIGIFTFLDRPDILKEYRAQINYQTDQGPKKERGDGNTADSENRTNNEFFHDADLTGHETHGKNE